jgi:hypothetical protein
LHADHLDRRTRRPSGAGRSQERYQRRDILRFAISGDASSAGTDLSPSRQSCSGPVPILFRQIGPPTPRRHGARKDSVTGTPSVIPRSENALARATIAAFAADQSADFWFIILVQVSKLDR